MDLLCHGQRPGDRRPVLREDLRDVSAPPQAGGVCRHRNWPGDLQEDRRAARRPHLGRITAGTRFDVSFRAGREWGETAMIASEGDDMGINILLVEDSPGDVRLTKEAFRDANLEVNVHAVTDG